ncbi:hypothetical protein [Roseateles depolymerans]|uniref:Uncharacterized protein n=1 Tax=Roseateles depolymerans TaxID=76731 RepID=A0A0U3MH26_9BURK|nr:hypothetical protein [Roseateles depolymerans]ALV07721.1 hypothetical protein RD2015_3263 [Roseateles depolymerans]REG22055.1 hypothetical protein DES44_1197 [Roseateles depolymerans]
MSIFIPPTTAEQPDAVLTSWRAFEVEVPGLAGPTIHIAGYIGAEGCGRVTSPIEELDAANRSVVTSSGRVYQLRGAPGLNGDAEYVWAKWQRLWKTTVLADATADLLRQFDGARPPQERRHV